MKQYPRGKGLQRCKHDAMPKATELSMKQNKKLLDLLIREGTS
jgi:hypothetical protein